MEQKVFLIILKALSLKEINSSFFGKESLALTEKFIFCAILLKISSHSLNIVLKEDSIFSAVTTELLLHENNIVVRQSFMTFWKTNFELL